MRDSCSASPSHCIRARWVCRYIIINYSSHLFFHLTIFWPCSVAQTCIVKDDTIKSLNIETPPPLCPGKCVEPKWSKDKTCDDENNNCGCNYDGGACCGNTGAADQYSYCSNCACLDPKVTNKPDPSTFFTKPVRGKSEGSHLAKVDNIPHVYSCMAKCLETKGCKAVVYWPDGSKVCFLLDRAYDGAYEASDAGAVIANQIISNFCERDKKNDKQSDVTIHAVNDPNTKDVVETTKCNFQCQAGYFNKIIGDKMPFKCVPNPDRTEPLGKKIAPTGCQGACVICVVAFFIALYSGVCGFYFVFFNASLSGGRVGR